MQGKVRVNSKFISWILRKDINQTKWSYWANCNSRRKANETRRDFSRLLWKQFRGKLEDLRFLRFPAHYPQLSGHGDDLIDIPWPGLLRLSHSLWSRGSGSVSRCCHECCHVICHVSWQSTIPGQISHGAHWDTGNWDVFGPGPGCGNW